MRGSLEALFVGVLHINRNCTLSEQTKLIIYRYMFLNFTIFLGKAGCPNISFVLYFLFLPLTKG